MLSVLSQSLSLHSTGTAHCIHRIARRIDRPLWTISCRHAATTAVPWPDRARPDYEVDHLVIGAGVVGLAVAERLTRTVNTTTLVLERHSLTGSESSARNSEVIHAGIYYPPESLKTRLCIRGREMMYDVCARHNIPHRKCGKWIVAQDEAELAALGAIHDRGTSLGVPLRFLSLSEREEKEPLVRAAAGALESPESGIVDSHALMQFLISRIEGGNAGEGSIALASEVVAMEKDAASCAYDIAVRTVEPDTQGDQITVIRSPVVVNAAGLYSDHIAGLLLGESRASELGYKIHPFKGHYYALSGRAPASRLVYPTPLANLQGLGVHLTLDMAGRCKLGPDSVPVGSKTDYSIVRPGEDGAEEERNRRRAFWESVKKYLPRVREEDIYPDYTGIRPKLSAPGAPFRDFVISHETNLGFSGFVNLVGELRRLRCELWFLVPHSQKLRYRKSRFNQLNGNR
ncbi:FAD dependent oxidoreductase [Gonapodya prolifera JEL478]|uniref:L-2-hydroxyglutarate dehydrogenase, mitochondrial n=1 Tax=Gonapodya prolifera (strain JEL478) TaxID=1344416 RepID=A0A139AWF9_GONPJ|nr:FAD dependent oxidoreductase [Gonapodya prolifera JEL478]|eukprot:KXS21076.1 FAD dependent oxidoreductase [Gonapodya prolifera JEL478]